jgi:hypothetical protein
LAVVHTAARISPEGFPAGACLPPYRYNDLTAPQVVALTGTGGVHTGEAGDFAEAPLIQQPHVIQSGFTHRTPPLAINLC